MKFMFFLFLFCFTNAVCAQNLLYPDEKMIEINKVQTLYKFISADASKPLIVFIPGDSHLARISYGCPQGKEDDFLSYWLHKKGYPFLGVSYPTDNLVYSKIYPNFSIRDWGNQVATLIKNLVKENHLSNHVVVLGWDLGGAIEESVQESLEKNHLTLDEFIALSAVPPLPNIMEEGNLSSTKMLSNHLASRKSVVNFFVKLLAGQNEYNAHEIIPEKIYTDEFIGNIPVALLAEGLFLKGNKFEFIAQNAIEDTGVFHFDHTPWIGIMTDDASSLAKITLVDSAAWNFIRSQMIYHQYMFYTNIETNINKFAITKRILNQIPQHFSDTVHGNHFFFVGKKGARETALKIELLMQHINLTKQNFVRLALE